MTTTATSRAAGSRLTLKPVVTIFEAYGSGGSDIGPKVAEALGLPFSNVITLHMTAPALLDHDDDGALGAGPDGIASPTRQPAPG